MSYRKQYNQHKERLENTPAYTAVRIVVATYALLALMASTLASYLFRKVVVKAAELLVTVAAFVLVWGMYRMLLRPFTLIVETIVDAAVDRLSLSQRATLALTVAVGATIALVAYRLAKWSLAPAEEYIEQVKELAKQRKEGRDLSNINISDLGDDDDESDSKPTKGPFK